MEKALDAGTGLNHTAAVRKQYSTADRLTTRISIHSKYSVNKQGFGNWIISHYRILEGMSVLELGCGTGEMWAGKQEIISRCSRFVLSDFSEGMLAKAKETLRDCGGIEYRVVDIQDIPFADQTFDVVIANMMLYHVPDLPRALREVRRVLKEDGAFYCATYGENGIMGYLSDLLSRFGVRDPLNRRFTLQNGRKILEPFFTEVILERYPDELAVTEPGDLADYLYSLGSMTDLDPAARPEIIETLRREMKNGVLTVPKEYGMFICR